MNIGKNQMKKLLVMLTTLVVVVIMTILVCFIVSAHRIPPKSATATALTFWAWRINEYVSTVGELPASLSDIPRQGQYSYALKDGWGRKIVYGKDSAGKITLLSYGRDGRKGGDGDDTDQQLSFYPHDPNSIYNDAFGRESPYQMTMYQLEGLEKAIKSYVSMTNKFPENLDEVEPLNYKIYGDSTVDFWGTKIIFAVKGKAIELKSLGEDQKEGGEREAKDVILRFEVTGQ